jgi:carboxypeptidase C (cathepsin A)
MARCVQVSNITVLDQPTEIGFSYRSDDDDTRHDETGVSNDLYDM